MVKSGSFQEILGSGKSKAKEPGDAARETTLFLLLAMDTADFDWNKRFFLG